MGCITGSAGGVIRDVLLNNEPVIFHKENQVYDIYGKLLQAGPVHSSSIRLGDYADGLYFVRILQNNQIITTEKIVKK